VVAIIRVLFFSVTAFIYCSLNGQTSSIFDDIEYNNNKASVRIIQNDDIRLLIEKHQWAKSKYKLIDGYRIRIFSNSGSTAKDGYDRALAKFAYSFDSIPIYPKFVYPNYKIYVGDFGTESEALKFRKVIERQFTGAFIVQAKINYPKLYLNE
jgi:hypothetical protein